MVGSDWPVCLVAGSYTQVINLVKQYADGQSTETQQAILGANAQRFWRLAP